MTQHLITRAEWGARESDGFDDRPMPIREWWLHHTVTVAPDLSAPFTDDDAAIRTLERIGEERFGGGVPYTYPVTPVGRIYQGHSLDRRGAHTKGHNTVGAAFALVGNFDKRTPPPAMEEAIARRMVIDHRAGRAVTHQLEGGHRDVSQTACPGAAAYARIPFINRRARALWAAGYPNTEEDDMFTDDDRAALAATLKTPQGQTLRNDIGYARDQILRALAAQADPATLAAELAPLLLPALEAAAPGVDLEGVLRRVLGSLDDASTPADV